MIKIAIPEGSHEVTIRENVNGFPLIVDFDSRKGVSFFVNKDGTLSKATTTSTPEEGEEEFHETQLPLFIEVKVPGEDHKHVYQRL